MKIVSSLQNNNITKPQKRNRTFGAGLTPKMLQAIQQTDSLQIIEKLEQKGIRADFKGDKVVAWCCDKTVELFEQINARFGTNLALPSGIFAEDFKLLDTKTPHAYGFCNLTPSPLIKSSKDIIPSRIVLFNTEHNWSNVNSIADENYASRHSSTDFFLYPFLHEFAHVFHEDNLLEKFDEKTVLKKILSAKKIWNKLLYRGKYGDRTSQICNYALTDPLEAIACDMPVKIISSLDKDTLVPIRNPFVGTPYEKGVVGREHSDKERPLQEILRRFWNGKFK